MDAVNIIITGHPVAKGRGRSVRLPNGRTIVHTPAKTRRWEEDARMVARTQMGGRSPFDGPVTVTIKATFAIPSGWPKWKCEAAENGLVYHTSKPDGDNIMKAAKDAMNGIVWLDDAQVVSATVSKGYSDTPSVQIVAVPIIGMRSQIKTKAEAASIAEWGRKHG